MIDSVRLVGRETGFAQEGEAEAQRLEAGFAKIRAVVTKNAQGEAAPAPAPSGSAADIRTDGINGAQRHGVGKRKKKVAFLEWLEPLFNGGHWIPDMVRAAGGEYTMAEPGEMLKSLEEYIPRTNTSLWVAVVAWHHITIVSPSLFLFR